MKIEGINGLTYFESVTLCFLLRGQTPCTRMPQVMAVDIYSPKKIH